MHDNPLDQLLVDARPAKIGIRAPAEVTRVLSALVACTTDTTPDAWIEVTETEYQQFCVAGPTGAHLAPSIDGAVRQVFSLLNRLHLDHAPNTLHLHAAAAAMGKNAVVISGPSKSGKSTLTAALCDRGFSYITDECVDVSRSGAVDAWHKPISLRGGGRALLGSSNKNSYEWRPKGEVACRPVVVIVLKPDASMGLEPIDRAEAIGSLIDQCLDFGRRRGDLATLAGLVSAATSYRMGRSGLDSMCDEVIGALRLADSSEQGRTVSLDLAPLSPRPETKGFLRWAESAEGVRIDDRTILFDRRTRHYIIVDGPTQALAVQLQQGASSDDLDDLEISEDFVSTLISSGLIASAPHQSFGGTP